MIAVAARTAAEIAQRGRPCSLRVRTLIEGSIKYLLWSLTFLSVATTAVIIAVLASETYGFFTTTDHPEISLWTFFCGTEWSPLLGAEPMFGVLPLVAGTLLVTTIAGVVALPIGLMTAIYLSEYATARRRTLLKAVLEILAGVPTVVYGFFALTFITPYLLQPFSSAFGTYNAMSAGIAVGIMILPIVCSLSEDALRAVPQSLRDGAYALGSTKFDVSAKVVVPAALSGIVAAFLLALTRAIGETMIVALAAGGLAQLTANPTAQVQTMTAYMVQIFLGDAPAAGIEYKSSYAVAFTLFLITFFLTWIGAIVLRRYREEYE
ncbi:MAG: phosphate ABC transporter permease subunit PstC [Phycisphaerales bacterium]|nr:phosphate ABC transporter permease subunit PstC [Phycisphaerales bacterium]